MATCSVCGKEVREVRDSDRKCKMCVVMEITKETGWIFLID